ncbi:helicase [Bacillus sp. J14TS2]|uniref:DEAD/DEAH box helicase n=1 Tax=Bacillus sp. J14TS2 TaxID=2807188 RepID=UPI001B2EFCC7|nr:DEAD/DEAH box helicase [Bacillus sp. J14TS2]GIN73172.1 helicase [Bacillus sp. J14TS2]
MLDYEELQKENKYLKKLMAEIMHHQNMDDSHRILTKRSPLSEKTRLLRELFKGRNDVYALRWESKSGEKGYKPARQKSHIKYDQTQNRKHLPLTDQVLVEHMKGKKTIGIYPLLKNETCMFLAIDFDKKEWKKDVLTFCETCKGLDIPYHVERSRSGNGAHIWIFFSSPISAKTARTLGMTLLKETAKNKAEFQLESFDRLFPNQDTMPDGGFGNLIALPLQKEPGQKGNSLFIDENFTPYPDQWLYLSTVRKMTKEEIDRVIYSKYRSLSDEESGLKYISKTIHITLKNGIFIKKAELPSTLLKEIIGIASFSNPQFYKAKQNRFSTKGIPRVIECVDEEHENLILPRGCFQDLLDLFNKHSIKMEITDEQYAGEIINVKFQGALSSQQDVAVKTLLEYQQGVLSATTGFGKTVLATSVIAERKVNTLVIVHRTQLMQQWVEKLAAFLKIPTTDIGQIGAGKKKITGFIDIATIQSLNYGDKLKSFITQYGQIIVDESHIISAVTFESVLKKIRPQYVLGLTATPKRKDGMHPIITMQCGPIRYQVDAKSQAQVRPFIHRLVPRKTNFQTKKTNFKEVCEELILNAERNQQIFDDVLKSLEKGRSPIILTNRLLHLEILTKMFRGFAKNIIVLAGNMKKREQKKELEKLSEIPNHEERLIIATGNYIGEGFDDARLDTLFLTMPISWKGTLHQYVGRLHREYDSKQEVQVYDYVDVNIPTLQTMYKKRLKGYKSIGYLNNDEESASEQMRLF